MILIALHYLHSKGIVHRDLKPANILIEEFDGEMKILKIGDFGISKVDIQKMKKTITSTLAGGTTPAYMAPELMTDENATSSKVDMWALGIILYQLVSSGRHPFEAKNFFVMMENIKYKNPEPLKDLSPFIIEIIGMLLVKNPYSRPDAETLIQEFEI
jgi:calcium/calmodulin-dependent protein kinase kinase 2